MQCSYNINMKRNSIYRTKVGWLIAWLVQIAAMLAVCLAASLTLSIHPGLNAAALWLLVPCAGGFTAFRAVKGGLLNYAAWIAPPICLYAVHRAVWGYAPPTGAALLCAFVSLVGAAAGEVWNLQNRKK